MNNTNQTCFSHHIAWLLVAILFSCADHEDISNCRFDGLNERVLIDSIIAKNMSTLPLVFTSRTDESDGVHIDSFQIAKFSVNESLIVSLFSFSPKELYFLLVEENCLDLMGYYFYPTHRKRINEISFTSVDDEYITVITGKERITNDEPTSFVDSLNITTGHSRHLPQE